MLIKIFRQSIILIIVLLVGSMVIANTASAANYEFDATLTGYTYMGGYGFNNSNESYFIAGPMEYEFSGSDMWGFAWIKFDTIGTEEVTEAYLNLGLLGVGSMDLMDATEDFPGIVDIYSPGDTDVASFTSAADCDVLHNILKTETPLVADFTMNANDDWAIDITDIYNDWVTGDQTNNGLILYSNSPNANEAGGTIGAVGSKYAGLNGSMGTAPYISTSDVPVPASVLLLGSGFVGLMGMRRRKVE